MAMAVLHNGTTMAPSPTTSTMSSAAAPSTSASGASTPTNEELWRECVTWLTRWEMLRPDHKVNWPTATITDFATILRDGVLLCRLLNKIDPGCIDMKDVNLKPTMAQFLCKKNINLFLKTCNVSFGLHATNDLFEDSMLYDLTNFHRVLCTLSKLSLTQKALKNNIPGFQAHKTTEEEVIYQQLKSVDIPSKSHRSSSGIENVDIMTSDEIYQHLCEVQRHSEQNVYEKRDYVIKELLETEKNYVDVLNKLRRNFMLPLKDIMNPDDFNVVFHKINELHQVHSAFYAELAKVKNSGTSKFSAVFMKWREKFLVYGKYCANLTKATNLLQELCDNDSNFNQAILAFENVDSNGRFKLRDVLSVPMQRILKYHLLLDKLVENTDPNDEEYNELRRAREAMIDVAGYINEAARDSEHLAVINNLQESITDMMPDGSDFKLSNHGRLIKDCELKIKAHNDQRTHNRYVFIFEKCILICKQPKKDSKFAFRQILNLADYHTEECHNRAILNKDARFSYCFLLVKNNNQNVFTVYLRTAEMKQQIMKAINDALENLHPIALKHTNHAFELYTFTNPIQCNHCSKYLKGLIFQGYRCSSCGIAAHKTCISSSGRCGSTPTPTSSNSSSTTTNANSSLNSSFEMGSSDGGLCHHQYHPLQDRLWFAGEMDRDTAQEQLRDRENGTYLVRIRPQKDEKEKYALTLKTADTVKHMIIYSNSAADVPSYKRKYYLSPCKYFNSIDELVINYQFNSLKENFERLEKDTKLLWPYKQLLAMAIRTFDTRNSKELSFTEGDYIRIIGREGYKEGWLRGRNSSNEVGYLPANYVHIEGEVNFAAESA